MHISIYIYNTQQQQEGHHSICHLLPFLNHHGTSSSSASQESPCSLRMAEGDAMNCSCCCSWQAFWKPHNDNQKPPCEDFYTLVSRRPSGARKHWIFGVFIEGMGSVWRPLESRGAEHQLARKCWKIFFFWFGTENCYSCHGANTLDVPQPTQTY